MNIEKEFQEWALNRGLNVKKSSGKPGAHYLAETTRLIQEGYLAAAEPRDALIAQLVGALKDAVSVLTKLDKLRHISPEFPALDKVDAALSAARDRGYA